MAVEYAKLRAAFGRKIGSFQAIKHKCANELLEVETARSALLYAVTTVDEPGTESAIAAALAQATSTEAYVRAARENIQIHGGIGFTWEHDAHPFLKRATADALIFGAPVAQRARLGVLAGVS